MLYSRELCVQPPTCPPSSSTWKWASRVSHEKSMEASHRTKSCLHLFSQSLVFTLVAVNVRPTLISPWYELSADTTLYFAAFSCDAPLSMPVLIRSVTLILHRRWFRGLDSMNQELRKNTTTMCRISENMIFFFKCFPYKNDERELKEIESDCI